MSLRVPLRLRRKTVCERLPVRTGDPSAQCRPSPKSRPLAGRATSHRGTATGRDKSPVVNGATIPRTWPHTSTPVGQARCRDAGAPVGPHSAGDRSVRDGLRCDVAFVWVAALLWRFTDVRDVRTEVHAFDEPLISRIASSSSSMRPSPADGKDDRERGALPGLAGDFDPPTARLDELPGDP